MIEVQNISFKYKGQKALVFDGFSLQLEENRIYGLLGKNGTGKSTLLYLLTGLLRPLKGSVCCDDIATCKRQPEMLRDMFLVTEEFDLPAIRLSEYVKLYKPFYPHFSDEILQGCLADFELPADVHLGELSMGQRKKAYIAFAMATNTKYLLMDEPTNGLDIPSKSQFRKVIARHMTCSMPRCRRFRRSTSSSIALLSRWMIQCSTPSLRCRVMPLSLHARRATRRHRLISNYCLTIKRKQNEKFRFT